MKKLLLITSVMLLSTNLAYSCSYYVACGCYDGKDHSTASNGQNDADSKCEDACRDHGGWKGSYNYKNAFGRWWNC